MTKPCLILFAALAAALPASAADNVFDGNERRAREALATPAGAAYDRALGAALTQSPTLAPAVDACTKAHAGGHSVHGYLQFARADAYQVVLRPQSAFSECLAAALEGHPVPAPPALPWYNHFVLAAD